MFFIPQLLMVLQSSSGLTSSDLSHHSQKEDSPKHGSHDQDAELEIMRQRLHQEGQRREEERLRQQQQQQQQQDGINQQALLRMQVLCIYTVVTHVTKLDTAGCLTRKGPTLQTP